MFFLSTVAAMGAEEWPKTCFQPENSYFTLFSPPITSVQGLTQCRIWFYELNVLSQDCGCYGGQGMAKNLFLAWKQLFHTLFTTNNLSRRLNPMQNFILDIDNLLIVNKTNLFYWQSVKVLLTISQSFIDNQAKFYWQSSKVLLTIRQSFIDNHDCL